MLDDSVLQNIFIGKLPQMVQVYLTAMGDNVPMYNLCDIADKLMKVMIQDNLDASKRISEWRHHPNTGGK